MSDKIVGPSSHNILYIFKQYDGHGFIKITYIDILHNKNTINAINSTNLMDIYLNEYLEKVESESYAIKTVEE